MDDGRLALSEELAAFSNVLSGRVQGERLAVVVAHPDDETIGLGGHLAGLPRAAIIHVTDGAPRSMADARRLGFDSREAYAAARRIELSSALDLVRHQPGRRCALGLPDQEAALHLGWLTRRLSALFAELQPVFVCTHPYEGGHPDHDACSFAVAAARQLAGRSGTAPPTVVEMAFIIRTIKASRSCSVSPVRERRWNCRFRMRRWLASG